MADDDIIERIGLNITVIRERRGFTQEKLAVLAGLHRAYFGYVEWSKNARFNVMNNS